jgi:hypothetical protein
MTLAAAILFIGFFFTSTDATLAAQSAPQSNSAPATESTQQPPSIQASPDTTKPSSSQPSSKAPVKKPKQSTAKKTQEKKVVSEATCDPAPGNASSPGSNNSPASEQSGVTQAPAAPDRQKNCPPGKKKVVQQGGIAEQSIQLAGASAAGEATQKRESTNQMLTATEENLKRVTVSQLSTAQQSSVSQIRQFVDQSKNALKAADFERAHTLAWKAKVLSDDLVNPK